MKIQGQEMQAFKGLKEFFNSQRHAKRLGEKIIYSLRAERLHAKILDCKEMGVSSQKYGESELLVSLTTYGKRFYSVATTIESIMQGTIKPNRIVLWLDHSFENKAIPVALQKQVERGLEICFCKDIKSYQKLIPSLKKYPEATIITIDDDAIYDYDLVERLLYSHSIFPNMIIANRVHQIKLDRNKKPLSYNKWRWRKTLDDASPLNFMTGVGGVLYPLHCLDDEIFNESVFVDICKYNDDIWFYAMALKKGTIVKKSISHSQYGEDFVLNEDVQDISLNKQNLNSQNCRNDIQFKAVFDKYNLYEKFLNL